MWVCFLVAALVSGLILATAQVHGGLSGDHRFHQPQKVHVRPVPRVGGVALALGLLAGIPVLGAAQGPQGAGVLLTLLLCATPVFAAGLYQDLTDALSPRDRLLAAAVGAVLAFLALDARIQATAIPGLDWAVGFLLGSLALTVLVVTGLTHAVNLIDGFNGLAALCVVQMLLGLACVAWRVDDALIAGMALCAAGAMLGFFVWNYPGGRLFLGDGGAYLAGFVTAVLAILLLQRHPGAVSPMCPLLLAAYPVVETLFSIYRRRVLRKQSPSVADRLHLHSLLYRRVACRLPAHGEAGLVRRNARTAPYLWLLCLLAVVPAVVLADNTPALVVALAGFGWAYGGLYRCLVRWRVPHWLRRPAPRRPVSAAVARPRPDAGQREA